MYANELPPNIRAETMTYLMTPLSFKVEPTVHQFYEQKKIQKRKIQKSDSLSVFLTIAEKSAKEKLFTIL